MKNINEYDARQLKLMYETLTAFENEQIALTSLVGNLEFLLTALESVTQDWEEKFLNEISTIETINALEIIEDASEKAPEIDKDTKKKKLDIAISNLKNLIETKLASDEQRKINERTSTSIMDKDD